MSDHRRAPRLGHRPVDGRVISTTRGQRLIALARDATALTAGLAFLRGLHMGGHTVVLVWAYGTPGPQLRDLVERHPLHPDGPELQLEALVGGDPQAQRLLREADGVIGFGAAARAYLREEAPSGDVRQDLVPVPRRDLRGWPTVARTWSQLSDHARRGALTRAYARHLIALTRILRDPAPPTAQVALTDLLAELERSGDREEAIQLLAHLRHDAADPVEAARRRAVIAQVRTSEAGREDPDLRPSANALIAVADTVLTAGDLTRTAQLVSVCLGSLFHAELHSDGLSTPLVEDPSGFLGAWQGSRVGRLLAAPVPRPRRRVRPTRDDRYRVVVAPGSYPRFATPVIAELRGRQDVEVTVLDWEGRPRAQGLGVREELIEQRLRIATGATAPEPEIVALLDRADAVFVDWADRGALLTLMHVPEGVRVVLRVHSMDALSPWLHLVDWSCVDHLVLVSAHLRDLVVGLLGGRLAGTDVLVLPNAVDLTRIPGWKRPGYRRRLLMVGWAPRVKDAEWALDVLDRLRADDPEWRLTLVGPDSSARRRVRSSLEHADRVHERLATATREGAVELVPATSDLAPWWRATGFSLNTSRRESFALALVEGVAAGAVPVVRNWPLFAALDGARRLFPDAWVVDTVEEAAERIRTHADPSSWAREAARAGTFVRGEFLGRRPAATLTDLVLGCLADPHGSAPTTRERDDEGS